MILIEIKTFKGSIRESTIDLILITSRLSNSLIPYKVAKNFDYNLDYQPIFSE